MSTNNSTNDSLESPQLNGSISGTGVKNENDLVSNSSTSIPTQSSVKAYVDTRRRVATATISPNTTHTASATGYTKNKLALNTISSSDGTFSMSSNGILIPTGVTKILVSGTIAWASRSNTAAEVYLDIFKNTTSLTSVYNTTNSSGGGPNGSLNITPFYVPVTAGDVIYLYWTSSVGSMTIRVDGGTMLTVDVVAQ